MNNIVTLDFPKCCECGSRATHHIELVDETGLPAGKKHFCADHGHVMSELELCLLLDRRDEEIAALRAENVALRQRLVDAPPK